MNCPKCNFPVSPGQRFCEACGAPLAPIQLDLDKTVAADVDNIPVPPAQPEPQQSAWAQPAQPKPAAYEPPAQPQPAAFEPSAQPQPAAYEPPAQPQPAAYEPPAQPQPAAYEPPAQPQPAAYEPPAQPQPAAYEPPVQPEAKAASPEWPEGGSVASAWDQPQQPDNYAQYQQPSYYSGNQYGYSPAAPQAPVKTANKKKIAIIIASAVVAVGLIVGLILIIVSCSGGGSHKIEISGKTVADDSAINTSDSATEKKLTEFIGNQSTETMKIYAKGNAVVYEERMTFEIPQDQRSYYQSMAKQSLGSSAQNLAAARAETGIKDMVAVYALFDSTGDLIYSEVIK